MNKKERKLACATALQSAASDMLVVESFEGLTGVSTKGLVASLAAMGIEEVRRRPLAPLSCPPLPASGRTDSAARLAWGGHKPCPTASSNLAVLLLHKHQPRPRHPHLPRTAFPVILEQGEKVLLIVNEANETVYLSGRNVPTLAINTANAVQARRRRRVLRAACAQRARARRCPPGVACCKGGAHGHWNVLHRGH